MPITNRAVCMSDAVRGMPYRRMNYICNLTIYRHVIVNYAAFIYNYNTNYNTNCTCMYSHNNHILHNTQREYNTDIYYTLLNYFMCELFYAPQS